MDHPEEFVASAEAWNELAAQGSAGRVGYGLIGVARGRGCERYLLAETSASRAGALARCAEQGMGLLEFHAACDTVEASSHLAAIKAASTATPLLVATARPKPAIWRRDALGGAAPLERLRLLSSDGALSIRVERLSSQPAPSAPPARLDRQRAALGQDGQRNLCELTVALVGCGGTGGLAAQLLALAGVGRIILIDDDRIEQSNRNRLVAASDADVRRGAPKVAALRRYLRRLAPDVAVVALPLSLYHPRSRAAIVAADALVGCTDNEGSRLHMNRLAIQYLLPYVDCGAGIISEPGGLIAGGRVRAVLPGGPCLECYEGIDRWLAAEDLAAPNERARIRAQGYGLEADRPAPSLASLNAVIAAEAAAAVVALATGLRRVAPFLAYDMIAARMGPRDDALRNPDCLACGSGRAGRGDSLPLPLPELEWTPPRAREHTIR